MRQISLLLPMIGLKSLEPRLRHGDARNRRFDSVGWCDGSGKDEAESVVLFSRGNPGVGKTYINPLVVGGLCGRAVERNPSVCFYIDLATKKEQSLKDMLGSSVREVSGLEITPEEISRTFKDQKKVIGGRGPQLPDIVTMLQDITSPQRAFICIDALCECVAGHRVELLDSLKENFQKSLRIGGLHIRAGVGGVLLDER